MKRIKQGIKKYKMYSLRSKTPPGNVKSEVRIVLKEIRRGLM